MDSLLDQDFPGLSKKLVSLPLEARRTILSRACLAVSKCLNQLELTTQGILKRVMANQFLSADEATKVKSLAEAADAKYLGLQSQNSDQQLALRYFSEARLLNGIAIGFRGDSPIDTVDAAYEISRACDDPTEVLKLIESDAKLALRN